MVGSLFNSHLFDFSEGWLYMLGVGVAGGLVARHLKERGSPTAEVNL
jgi:O-antigen ligase